MSAKDSTGLEFTEVDTPTCTIEELPNDAIKIGVDSQGLEIHFSKVHTAIYVLEDGDIRYSRDDITPGPILNGFVDHIADTRGWTSLNIYGSFLDAFNARINEDHSQLLAKYRKVNREGSIQK